MIGSSSNRRLSPGCCDGKEVREEEDTETQMPPLVRHSARSVCFEKLGAPVEAAVARVPRGYAAIPSRFENLDFHISTKTPAYAYCGCL